MRRDALTSEAPTRDTPLVDALAFVAFLGSILAVFATWWSWVWPAFVTLFVAATLPRRSTRTVGRWAIAGFGCGVAAIAVLLGLLALGGPLIFDG